MQGSPTGTYCEPGVPEVMLLSNIVENGKPIGLADAGQDWHTDMSYNELIGFINVLYAIKIPRRNGQPLGNTVFADMHAAYDDLSPVLKTRSGQCHRDARLQQVLGGDAPPARQHSPGADAGAARQAAGFGASGVPDASDHRTKGSLRQSRLHHPHQRAARSGERRGSGRAFRAPACAEIPARSCLDRRRRAGVGPHRHAAQRDSGLSAPTSTG